MNKNAYVCIKCSSAADHDARFCSVCGSDLLLQRKISSGRIKISIRWVLFSIIAILIFEYIFATLAGQLFLLITGGASIEFETGILVSSAGSLAGIFFGTMYSAYMSPGFSIKEPMIGAALEILSSQLILLIIAGTFTSLFIVRIIIIMTIAFFGAKSGDFMQKKYLNL